MPHTRQNVPPTSSRERPSAPRTVVPSTMNAGTATAQIPHSQTPRTKHGMQAEELQRR